MNVELEPNVPIPLITRVRKIINGRAKNTSVIPLRDSFLPQMVGKCHESFRHLPVILRLDLRAIFINQRIIQSSACQAVWKCFTLTAIKQNQLISQQIVTSFKIRPMPIGQLAGVTSIWSLSSLSSINENGSWASRSILLIKVIIGILRKRRTSNSFGVFLSPWPRPEPWWHYQQRSGFGKYLPRNLHALAYQRRL